MEKILYINEMNFLEKNGGAIFEKRIYENLKKKYETRCTELPAPGRSLLQKIKDIFFSPIPTLYGLKDVRKLKSKIKETKADIVFLSCSRMGYLAKYAKKFNKKVICFFQNCEGELFKDSRGKIFVPFIKKQEYLSIMYSDYYFFLNERDRKSVEKLYKVSINTSKYSYLPITLEDKLLDSDIEKMTTKAKGQRGLFLGSYFPPNYKGVEWFAKNVGEKINATIDIVGFNFERYLGYVSKNMNIVGTVDNVKDYIINADFVISPIFEGSGMKVKTCEALMYGKKIFATDEALEGYEILPGCYVRCNTSEEFVFEINNFIKNTEPVYCREARELFLQYYSESSFEKKLDKVIEGVLDK